MTNRTRSERLGTLEAWADTVESDDLVEADTSTLRTIAALVDERQNLDRSIAEAVKRARSRQVSWSQIGGMLGVSKQAAQQKYADA